MSECLPLAGSTAKVIEMQGGYWDAFGNIQRIVAVKDLEKNGESFRQEFKETGCVFVSRHTSTDAAANWLPVRLCTICFPVPHI